MITVLRSTNTAVITVEASAAWPKRKIEFKKEVVALVETRRSGHIDDLLGDIVNATSEDDERLSVSELVATVEQLLAAGIETTAAHLTFVMSQLASSPGLLADIKRDPSLIPRLIDETIRLETPTQIFWRLTTERSIWTE